MNFRWRRTFQTLIALVLHKVRAFTGPVMSCAPLTYIKVVIRVTHDCNT